MKKQRQKGTTRAASAERRARRKALGRQKRRVTIEGVNRRREAEAREVDLIVNRLDEAEGFAFDAEEL